MKDKTSVNVENEPNIINEKAMNVDTVLAEIGSFGRFHIIQFFLIALPVAFTSLLNANFVFVAEDIDYRCKTPQCDVQNTNTINPNWLWNITDRCTQPILKPGYNETFYESCSQDMFANSSEYCHEWIYENKNSIVEAFNMACKPWQRTLVGTIHNLGMMVSMPLLGYVSDRFGRKSALIASAAGGGGLGVLKTFTTSYPIYLIFEFLEATLGAATYTSAFVLLIELGGQEKRILGAALIGFAIAFGEVSLALVAQVVPYWKNLLWITYTPSLLFILYTCMLSESIRWQLINGKRKQAKHSLKRAAKCNRVKISDEVLTALDKLDLDSGDLKKQEPFQIKHLFVSMIILRRLVISSICWFSAGFIYYGMMIYSINLPGNKYTNFMLSSAIAFPGDIIAVFTLNVFGRRKTLLFAYLFCGACCVISAFIPESLEWLYLVIWLLGKMAISTCFNGIYIYSSELFPTNMRTSLVGICSMFSRMGSLLAPQAPLLSSVMESLPSIMFGIFALLSGITLVFTPETLNQKLPDTVQDAEDIGKEKPKTTSQGVVNENYNISD